MKQRPTVLKRLYLAIFLILGFVFLLVAFATVRWWLAPETAIISFFTFGVLPIAFYTLFGTTIMDPGKVEQGGIVDKSSPRFVDRFGAAAWPVVIFSMLFGTALGAWFIPQTRRAVLASVADVGMTESLGEALFDQSRAVSAEACNALLKTGAPRPRNAIAYHTQRETEFGPEIVDCLATMPGDPIEVSFAATAWHDELKGPVDDDRACRLTNRLRAIADAGSEQAILWLLEYSAVGHTEAIKACSAQSLRTLAQKENLDVVAVLPTAERAANWDIRYHADQFFRAAFDPESTTALNEFASWAAPPQRLWTLEFACASLGTTKTNLIDKKLNAYVGEACGFEDPNLFARMCEQEELEIVARDLCGSVTAARSEMAHIEARGAIRRGIARGNADRMIGLIMDAAKNEKSPRRGSKVADILGARFSNGKTTKVNGVDFGSDEMKNMLDFIGKNGKMTNQQREALQELRGSDNRDGKGKKGD